MDSRQVNQQDKLLDKEHHSAELKQLPSGHQKSNSLEKNKKFFQNIQGQIAANNNNLDRQALQVRNRSMTAQNYDEHLADCLENEKDPNKRQPQEVLTDKSDRKDKNGHIDAKNKSLVIDQQKFSKQQKKSLLGQTMQVAPKFSNVDHSSVMRDDIVSRNASNMSHIMKEMSLQYKPKNIQESIKDLEREYPNFFKDKKVHDPDRTKVITVLCLINLFANSAYSSIAPFYPYEAVKKGLPQETLGFIFAGYSLSMCLFAPLFGLLLNRVGRKNVLVLGCLCESIAMFCFGLFVLIEDPVSYGIASFLCRMIEGFGNGCLNSATSSIISFNYADNMGNLMGLTQTFTGLGMLAGPIFGSILYEAGGFKLPFFVTGALLFVLIFPISCLVKNDKGKDVNAEEEHQSQQSQFDQEVNDAAQQMQLSGNIEPPQFEPIEENARMPNYKVTFFNVLCQFKITATALCMSTSLMCLTFKEPLLQLRLKEEDISVWVIGIVFSMDTITYTLTSTVLNFVPETKKNFQKIVAAGTFFFLFGMLLTGPVPFLPNKVSVICVGILVGGIGGALINNNCVPALNQILEHQLKHYSNEQTNCLKNYLSAINTGAFGFGSILGPILASLLGSATNFAWSFTICSALVLVVVVIQLLAVAKKSDDLIKRAGDGQFSSIYMSEDDRENFGIQEQRKPFDKEKEGSMRSADGRLTQFPDMASPEVKSQGRV